MDFSRPTVCAAGNENHQSCDGCERAISPLYFCNACDCTFCDDCWDRQPAHRNKRNALHEKTDYAVVQKVRSVLSPPTGETAQEALFGEDANTTWFGIERDRGGPLMFQDYGKYAELLDITKSERSGNLGHHSLSKNPNVSWGARTPSLVSFAGQTGAGKSTVIKFLVEFCSETARRFAAPVVGASGANVPSSEDVHLYMDPLSAMSDTPILYADCEGLEGGEREPLGAKFKRKRTLARHPEERGPDRTMGYTRYSSELELAWANSSNTRSREFAVSNLYPRLLYTFSDAIVFVLRNPRVVEGVFQRLIEWAAAALEKSSNQPILPHAVIVLNDSPLDIDPVEWDIEIATERLLASLKDTIFQNAVLQKHVQFWRERGRRIEKLEDLLLAYYGSLQIVRFPTNGRPNLMKEQVIRLYSSIQWACGAARQRKTALRMLLDAEELQSYLQCAFEHYAKTLDFPFDFVEASFTLSPIPLDFGGNILKLALNLMDAETDARVIFQKLGYMVASCIMLDSVRHKIKGTADHILPQYLNHLNAALIAFCARHWPCEFVADDGSKCVNVQSGHGSKGHQNKSGKVLAVGDYVSRFSFEGDHEDFQNAVYFHLEDLLELLRQRIQSGDSQDAASARIHRDVVMARFYSHSTGGQASAFHSHNVCFSCLCEPPQHALPCGHVLCTACVKSYGRANNKTLVELDECPMEAHSSSRHFPYTVYLKPKMAGVRILALDGDGIRGIIQIEFLRMIEQAFHGRIPIQYFFDLIVGDGASGVFALGLAACHWSVEECAEKFGGICSRAFIRRTGGKIPGISWFIDNYKSKFQSRPLQRALIDTFSENQLLFGGRRPSPLLGSDVKVAVTATSHGDQTIVLANYNRQHSGPLPYHFCRPDKSSTEFKVWEAAMATSATMRLFKPFHHEPSKQFFANDPLSDSTVVVAALEWKAIWHDLEQDYPDILLSVGTGCNPSPQSPTIKQRRRTSSRIGTTAPGMLGSNSRNEAALTDRQSAWDAYMIQLPDSALGRFIRLNPEFSEDLPAIDDVGRMESLQRMVREHVGIGIEIRRLVPRLLASLFYFELSEPILEAPDNSFVAKGDILCRLPPTSPGIRGLGKFIKESSIDEPCFLIRDAATGSTQCIKFGTTIIGTIRDRQFELDTQTIPFSSKESVIEVILSLKMTGYGNVEEVISGFPRSLFSNESSPSRQCQSAITSSSRWVSPSGSRQRVWTTPDLERAPKNSIVKGFENPKSDKGDPTIVLQSAPDRPDQLAHLSNPSPKNIGTSSKSIFRPSFSSPVAPPRTNPSAISSAKAHSQRASVVQFGVDREPAELDATREPAELDATRGPAELDDGEPVELAKQSTAQARADCDLDTRETDVDQGSRPEAQLFLAQSHRLGTFGQDQLGQSREQNHWTQRYGEGHKLAQDHPIGHKTTEQPKQYRLTTQSRGKSQPEEKGRLTKHLEHGSSQTGVVHGSQKVETAWQKSRGARESGHRQGVVATQQPDQLSRKLKEIEILDTILKTLSRVDLRMGDEIMSAMCWWGKRRPSEASYYVMTHGTEWPQDADPDDAILIYRLILQQVARKDKADEERVRDTILKCSQDSNPESALSVYELFEQDLEREPSELQALQDEKN